MNFLKSLSIYGVTSVLNAALPFVLLPVLTAYLLPNEYGLLSIIQVLILLTVPFISVNIATVVQAQFHRLGKHELARFITTVLLIPVCGLIIISLVFVVAEPAIRRIVDVPLFWIVLIPVIAFFHVVPRLVLSLHQMSEQPVAYGQFQVILALVNLGASIVLVAILHWNWEGRLTAILVSYAIFTVVGVYRLRKLGFFVYAIDKQYIAEALKIGVPLILHVVSATLFMMSDRLFISYYLGNESVGLYAVGAQIAMIAMLIQETFNQAWVPYLFRNLSTNQIAAKNKIIKISYIALLFFLLLPFFIEIISSPLYEILVDDKYLASIEFVFWIALGYSFLGMYKVVTGYIFYEKKTHILAVMSFGSLVINIILNYFFIHKFGAIGVAYATALTVGVFFIMAAIIAFIVHPMPWFSFIAKKQ